MAKDGVIYGGSESYRHMCRFNSGFFYEQEPLLKYDFYWRVEPGIDMYCDIDFDPFLLMQANNKTYGFTIALYGASESFSLRCSATDPSVRRV